MGDPNGYTIATVDDDTPDHLGYGDYRGLVLLNPDGECYHRFDDIDGHKPALNAVADGFRLDPNTLAANADGPDDWYGPSWTIMVA